MLRISGADRQLPVQTFHKPLLLEPLDERAVDELFWLVARGGQIPFAEVFKDETNAFERRAR